MKRSFFSALFFAMLVFAISPSALGSTAAADADDGFARLRYLFAAGDFSSLDSLIGVNRFSSYRAIRTSLETYFQTDSAGIISFCDTSANVVARRFSDDFYTRQVDLYASWSTAERLRRRDLNRAFDQLPASSKDLSSGDFAVAVEDMTDEYLALADTAAAAKVCQNAALLLMATGGREVCKTIIARSLLLCRRYGDLEGLARSFNLFGQYYSIAGDLARAGSHFDSARAIRVEIGDQLGAASCLNNIAGIYLNLGELGKAREMFIEALRIKRALRDSLGVADVLLNMVSAFGLLEPDSLIADWLAEAQAMTQKTSDPFLRARLGKAAGLQQERFGRPTAALREYERALSLLPVNGALRLQVPLRIDIARVKNQLGFSDQALADYLLARDLAERSEDRKGLAGVAQNLAASYQRLGNFETALDYYHESLDLLAGLPVPCAIIDVMVNAAELQQQIGDSESALKYVRESRQLLAHCTDPSAQAKVYTLLRHWEPAYLDSAVLIYRELDNNQGVFDATILKAELLRLGKRYDSARVCLSQAAASNVSHASYANILKYSLALGLLFCDVGDLDSAHLCLAQTIDKLEQGRIHLSDPDLRAYRLQRNRFIYEMMVLLFVRRFEQGAPAAIDSVFRYIQHAKSRVFLDELGRRHPLKDSGQIDVRQESARTWSSPEPGQRQRLSVTGTRADRPSDGQQVGDAAFKPDLATLYDPTSATIKAIQRNLSPGSVVLDYLLSREESVLLVMTADSAELYPLKGREAIIDDLIDYLRLLRESAANEGLLREFEAAEPGLAATLLGGFSKKLSEFSSVVVCGDGPLAALPFDAIKIAGDYLIELAEVSYISSSVLLTQKASESYPLNDGKLLAIADPQSGEALAALPYSTKEAEWIASVFPETHARIIVGAEPAKSLLTSPQAHSFDVIHFATHSSIDRQDTRRSRLWLDRDTSSATNCLTLAEVVELDLDAELVVLSSCESASGRYRLGEGFEGFVRGFFFAGARNLVASLWPVEDFSTAVFMRHFYQNLDQGCESALRLAKREMLHSPRRRHRHPHCWAAFVLVHGPRR